MWVLFASISCAEMSPRAGGCSSRTSSSAPTTHLGQLITYAAGLKAATIVWVAAPFTEEHRAALDWLNEITDSRFNFFGLEIELWRIGESPIAPKFNLVSKPNDWSKIIVERATKPLPQHWMNLALGRSGFGLAAVASFWNSELESYDIHEVRAELTLTGTQAKAQLDRLEILLLQQRLHGVG
jgi:hypothetical protein